MTTKPADHPIWAKYNSTRKLNTELYWNLHTDFLVPTIFKIDVEEFEADMWQEKNRFLPWGTNRPELNEIRQGMPLVNYDGRLSDNDISIGPLDHHNKDNPDNCLLECDFVEPTALLNLRCFDTIKRIKSYMCRSSVLYWKEGANFLPHFDVILPTVNLRLWGTNNPNNVSLRYKKDDEMIRCENVEAGRLYLIETSTIHDATCINNDVYQFFFGLNIDSYPLLKECINV